MKAFTTWKHRSLTFLAFPGHSGVVVIDENGRNYGSWLTVERFREVQSSGGDLAKPLDTNVRLFGQTTLSK